MTGTGLRVRVRRAGLLLGACAVVASAALLPLGASPGSDSAAPGAMAMQVGEPQPGWDPNPLCLCPVCTSLREQPSEQPAGPASTLGVPII